MKPQLSEAHVAKIMEQLLERFGEPIGSAQGDRQGVPSGGGKKDMGNRGFGAKLQNEAGAPAMCDQCGGMYGMDEHTCGSCGQMSPHMEPPVGGGGHVVPSPAGAEVPPAVPGVGMVAVTVKGGPGANKGGGGRFAQGLTVKDMDGIPTSGSGRGTQSSSKAAMPEPPAQASPQPKPMPAEMDEDESESKEDAQERLGFDIDHDGERGEPEAHKEKVLRGSGLDQGDLAGADDMDEYGGLDQEGAPPSGGSSPPPSGGSGGSTPPPAPKPPMPEPSGGGGGGGSSPPPSGGSDMEEMDEDMDLADLDEKAPPGREKQVKALKKAKGVDNPFAVAWASYNKSHKKK